MPIFALFQGISAKSGLAEPLSTDWCRIDSLTWGVDRPAAGAARPTGAEVSLGIANVERVRVTKPTDGASTYLFAKAIAGNLVGGVTFALTDGASNKTTVCFKLDQAFIVAANLTADGGGAPRETLEIAFNKIAMAVLTPGGVQLCTWDLTTAKPWPAAAQAFVADPRWGIRVRG